VRGGLGSVERSHTQPRSASECGLFLYFRVRCKWMSVTGETPVPLSGRVPLSGGLKSPCLRLSRFRLAFASVTLGRDVPANLGGILVLDHLHRNQILNVEQSDRSPLAVYNRNLVLSVFTDELDRVPNEVIDRQTPRVVGHHFINLFL